MRMGAASLLSLSVALPFMTASLPAAANENVQPTMKGQKAVGGKPCAVELVYGFEENKPSGAFTLTTHR
jgi:hypothetical protein